MIGGKKFVFFPTFENLISMLKRLDHEIRKSHSVKRTITTTAPKARARPRTRARARPRPRPR